MLNEKKLRIIAFFKQIAKTGQTGMMPKLIGVPVPPRSGFLTIQLILYCHISYTEDSIPQVLPVLYQSLI